VEQNNLSRKLSRQRTQALKVLRIPVEAEQSVLGGLICLYSGGTGFSWFIGRAGFLPATDHQAYIPAALPRLMERRNPVRCHHAGPEWHNHVVSLIKSGELAYLGALARIPPSAANIKAMLRLSAKRFDSATAYSDGNNIWPIMGVYAGRAYSEEYLDTAERRVFEIAEKGAKRGRWLYSGLKMSPE